MSAKDRPLTQFAASVALGPTAVERLNKDLCPLCGGEAKEFKDKASREEHKITGLCQTCQDKVFAGLKEDPDAVDLSKATLFCSDAAGVYIPQYFAQNVKREFVTGVSDEDYKVLEAGPSHEHYWDAWADVCDNAKINDPDLGECYLYQDGDLWIVPVERLDQKTSPEGTKVVLGHVFHPMDGTDWEGWAGADEGSLISHNHYGTLILSPDGSVTECVCSDDGSAYEEFVWTKNE